jgi:hypothetical protein
LSLFVKVILFVTSSATNVPYFQYTNVLNFDIGANIQNNIAAAINAQDNVGNSPLHIAAQVNRSF